MRLAALLAAALLAGCASQPQYTWQKRGATEDDWQTDLGQCRAQAMGTANVTLFQLVVIEQNCMIGKGWRKVRA